MIVIVEGIDRVGKTTLVKELVAHAGFKEIDLSANPFYDGILLNQVSQETKIRSVLACLKVLDSTQHVVIDRFHISEWVYGSQRGYDCSRVVFQAEDILKQLGAILVYVNPINLNYSSKLHGKILKYDLEMFNKYIANHNTLKTIQTNFYELCTAILDIVKWQKERGLYYRG